MRRTKAEAMKTRAAIMESALEVFGEKNFSNASVSEITARIGLSKGAFYWHFKNKHDILLKIVEESCAKEAEESVNIYSASPDAVGSMRSCFKEAIARLKNDEHYHKVHKLMIRRHEWPDEVQQRVFEILRNAMDNQHKLIESYLTELQKDGRVKKSLSARKAAVLFTALSHGIAVVQLSGLLPDDFVESLDIFFDAINKEFAPEG